MRVIITQCVEGDGAKTIIHEIEPNFVTDIVFSDFSDKPVPHFSANYCSKNVRAESSTVMRLALYVDGWIDWVG